MLKLDEFFMREALKEAEAAAAEDEVPVGAVIVYKKRIIGRAHNQIRQLRDPTAHAEMLGLTQAASYLRNERLTGVSVYATLEPCAMCVGALILGRVKEVVFGAPDPKSGACGGAINLVSSKKLNHRIRVRRGICREECAGLLQEFFRNKRKRV